MALTPLHRIILKLEKYHGEPAKPFPTDPFQQILWVNVAYLADDARRAAAFKALKANVGLTPEKILHAPIAKLRTATKFGILPDRFAEKLRECAQIALDNFEGNLLKESRKLSLPPPRRSARFGSSRESANRERSRSCSSVASSRSWHPTPTVCGCCGVLAFRQTKRATQRPMPRPVRSRPGSLAPILR